MLSFGIRDLVISIPISADFIIIVIVVVIIIIIIIIIIMWEVIVVPLNVAVLLIICQVFYLRPPADEDLLAFRSGTKIQ